MHRFLIVIEKAKKNYSAYSPDLPGCVAAGKTKETVEKNMHSAIKMRIRGLVEDNKAIPASQSEEVSLRNTQVLSDETHVLSDKTLTCKNPQ